LRDQRGIDQWNWFATEAGKEFVIRRIREHEVYALQDKDQPIATVTLQYSDHDIWGSRGQDGLAGYVHGLAVVRPAAGRGLGHSLIRWAEQRFAEQNKSLCRLDCMAANGSLRSYYEKLGFVSVGVKQFDRGLVAALYERRIVTAGSTNTGTE
jgi:protein-tyrosine phosphatase